MQRNTVLMRSLKDKCVNIEAPRSIELHFWAKDEEAAIGLTKELRNDGLDVGYCGPVQPQQAGLWNVEAVIEESIAQVTEVSFILRMIRAAANHSGTFDGWGVSV